METALVQDGPFYGYATGLGVCLGLVAFGMIESVGAFPGPAHGIVLFALVAFGGLAGFVAGRAYRRRFPRAPTVRWGDLDDTSLSRTRWFVLGVGAGMAVMTAAALTYTWFEWTFFALIVTAFYFMGMAALMPWRTPLRKAVTIGISAGMAFAAIVFWLGLRDM
jgi:hypothetical protein